MITGTKEPTKHVCRAVFLPTIWELKSGCYQQALHQNWGIIGLWHCAKQECNLIWNCNWFYWTMGNWNRWQGWKISCSYYNRHFISNLTELASASITCSISKWCSWVIGSELAVLISATCAHHFIHDQGPEVTGNAFDWLLQINDIKNASIVVGTRGELSCLCCSLQAHAASSCWKHLVNIVPYESTANYASNEA